MNSVLQKLRPWQPAVVEKTIAGLKDGNFLNGSSLGTGKSYTTVATAKLLNRPLLVVCRIGARTAWKEVADLFDYQIWATNRESLRTGNSIYGTWIFGEFNGNTGKHSKEFKWTVTEDTIICFDEIHWDSGLDSLNSKVLRGAVKQGLTIIGLSGTAADDPRKMRAIGYMLGLHNDVDFYQWLARQGADRTSWDCCMQPETLTTNAGKCILRQKRQDIMARIHKKMIDAGRFVRVRKSEIPGFPTVSIFPTCIDFNSTEMKAIFAEMQIELARLRAKSGNPKMEQREIMIRALQKAELLMVPEIVEECEDGIEEGHSVPIFVQFTETVNALAARLKTDCLYTGQQNVVVRETNRMRFQSGERRVIIVNMFAGSESIGLQDVTGDYPRLGLVTPTFNAVMLNQLLGRLPRDGSQSHSIYKLLFPAGTILESAYYATKAKTARQAAFNGDVTFDESDLTAGLNL